MEITTGELQEFRKILRMALAVCGKCIIFSDIIATQGSSNIYEDEDELGINIPGSHVLMNNIIFNDDFVYVFDIESLNNLKEYMDSIPKTKKSINTIDITENGLTITNKDTRKIALIRCAVSKNPKDELFRFNRFEDIEDLYFTDKPDVRQFEFNDLRDMKSNKVINIYNHDETDKVRLGKNCFPFIGVSRLDSPPNFTGEYRFVPAEDENSGYLINHMFYKSTRAIHKFLYTKY